MISDERKVSPEPKPDDDGRAVAGGDDLARIARRDAGHGEGPFELADGGADGLLEGAVEVLLDEVDDDLGVRLGPEAWPSARSFSLSDQ